MPVGNARRCYALVLYGGHEVGTDLNSGERHVLGSLARDAEIAYAQVESDTLRRRIAVLEKRSRRRWSLVDYLRVRALAHADDCAALNRVRRASCPQINPRKTK